MTHEDFLKAAAQMQAGYEPSEVVRQHLSQVDFVPIIGPSGVGKSTIIRALHLPLVMSDMTRSIREGEVDGYDAFFRADYDRMYEELGDADFVQFVIGPDGEFYATRSNSYPPRGPAVMPMVMSTLPSIRSLGFKSVTPIYIVAPSFEDWMQRFDTMGHTPERRAKRLDEARQSLELGLSDPSVVFVLNATVDEAVATIQSILRGDEQDENITKTARAAAQAMLYGLGQGLFEQ